MTVPLCIHTLPLEGYALSLLIDPGEQPRMEGGNVFGRLGPLEILLIVAILVFLFGAKKLPELARGMGLGIKEFRKGLKEAEEGVDEPDDSEEDTEG